MTSFKNIFVTVGTTKFTKLIETVISPDFIEVLIKFNVEVVLLQLGEDWKSFNLKEYDVFKELDVVESEDQLLANYISNSGHKIKFQFVKFIENFDEQIRKSDFIITHGGAGSCLDILRQNKPFIIVINEDLMDNHQLELADQLQTDEYAFHCTCETLKDTLQTYKPRKKYPTPNKTIFSNYLDRCMGFVQ